MATRKTPSAKKTPTARDMDERVSLYPLPFERAVAAILEARPVENPPKDSEKAA
jgi:hypothetical protein